MCLGLWRGHHDDLGRRRGHQRKCRIRNWIGSRRGCRRRFGCVESGGWEVRRRNQLTLREVVVVGAAISEMECLEVNGIH